MDSDKIRIIRNGTRMRPWRVQCGACPGESLHYVEVDAVQYRGPATAEAALHGAVVVNDRGIGNRTWGLAMAAAWAHIRWHRRMTAAAAS